MLTLYIELGQENHMYSFCNSRTFMVKSCIYRPYHTLYYLERNDI
jgi:hypothetical protein